MGIRYLVGLSTGLMISMAVHAEVFPSAPLKDLTPGVICTKPDNYRYPEHIAYCDRDVDPTMKWQVIALYTKAVPGFAITGKNRAEYKIDHYIPLCMGGANELNNLWPQHSSIYTVTDIIEEDLCKQMQDGTLLQVDAVAEMKFAKAHVEDLRPLPTTDEVMQYVKDHYKQADPVTP